MIATALTAMFGLQHPIVLGPMGGVSGGHLAEVDETKPNGKEHLP